MFKYFSYRTIERKRFEDEKQRFDILSEKCNNIDNKYKDLYKNYQLLLNKFSKLKKTNKDISVEKDNLEIDWKELKFQKEILEKVYEKLKQEKIELEEAYDKINLVNTELSSEKLEMEELLKALEKDCEELKIKNNKLLKQLKKKSLLTCF